MRSTRRASSATSATRGCLSSLRLLAPSSKRGRRGERSRRGWRACRSSTRRRAFRRGRPMAETTKPGIRSPFYKAHSELGATFMEEGGWFWTEGFGDLDAEYRAVRDDLGVWDVSPLNKWSFT